MFKLNCMFVFWNAQWKTLRAACLAAASENSADLRMCLQKDPKKRPTMEEATHGYLEDHPI